jgi:two-component system cell cycle sensor histidine kinase/response regulator CckA
VVLLADDEAIVRDLARFTLTRAGFTVLSASDGAEALEVSRQYAGIIHVLLSDIRMPNMDGLELAEALEKERPEIRILLMTGFSSGSIPPGLRPHLLRKPFLPADLVLRIETVLRDCSTPLAASEPPETCLE